MKVEFPLWIGRPPYRQLIHDAKQLAQYARERGALESAEAFANRKMTFERSDFRGLPLSEQWRAIFRDACALKMGADQEWRRLMHLLKMDPDGVHEVREVLSRGEWLTVDLSNGSAWMKSACKKLDWKSQPEPRSVGAVVSTPAVNKVLSRMKNVVSVNDLQVLDSEGVRLPQLFGRVVPFSLLIFQEYINFHGAAEEEWQINTPKLLRLAGCDDAECCVFEQRLQQRTRGEIMEDALRAGGQEWKNELQAAWRRMGRKNARVLAVLDAEIEAERERLKQSA
jgi:hypothetical protein